MCPGPRRVVAIHQPNFFPWLGFFDKIARADVFILLDDVQFQKKGGCWTNRVRLLVRGEPRWVTAPVVRSYHGTLPVSEVRTDETRPWRQTLLRLLREEYGDAPFADEVTPLLSRLIANDTDRLADYNAAAIRAISEELGLLGENGTSIVTASSLPAEGSATDLLISLTRAVGGTAYLCGGGADGYQEDDKFRAAGVELIHQDFRHPAYRQNGSDGFQEGLSVIDALYDRGFEGTRQFIATRAAEEA